MSVVGAFVLLFDDTEPLSHDDLAAAIRAVLTRSLVTVRPAAGSAAIVELVPVDEAPDVPAPPTPPAPPRRYATVDGAKTPSLRLRSAPNAADPANIVGAITPADGPLEILGERRVGTTTWYELDAKGLRGWASGSYLIVSGG